MRCTHKILIRFSGALVGMLWLGGCSDAEEVTGVDEPEPRICSEAPSGKDILPLQEGNRWRYRFEFGNPDTGFTLTNIRIVEVGARQYRPGYDGAVYEYRDYDSKTGRPEWSRLFGYKDRSLFTVGGLSEKGNFGIDALRYKYPAAVGESFEFFRGLRYSESLDDWVILGPDVMKVLSADTSITTPVGTFDAIAYRYFPTPAPGSPSVGLITEYMAPGVGLVYATIRTEGTLRMRFRWVLSEYCLHRE